MGKSDVSKGPGLKPVFEAGSDKLRKVSKSGGGRCNVMHDPCRGFRRHNPTSHRGGTVFFFKGPPFKDRA